MSVSHGIIISILLTFAFFPVGIFSNLVPFMSRNSAATAVLDICAVKLSQLPFSRSFVALMKNCLLFRCCSILDALLVSRIVAFRE